ncbi:hypothetical protein ACJW31_05G075100 [Castanea mollissima]
MSMNEEEEAVINEVRQQEVIKELKEKKVSSQKLRVYESDMEESDGISDHHNGHNSKNLKWSVILNLTFQSIGVVYGDIGTSPLYVYASTFTDGIKHNDDILGVLSLIFYSLTLIPLINYVFIVLRANDNGEGGTFALYSLICRYAKVSLIPNQQVEDHGVSNYRLQLPNGRQKRASWLVSNLEKSNFAKCFLLFATMLGTSMVIGDGVLTPCISVLSAVGGLQEATSKITDDLIVWISVAILILLFLIQRFGTDKVGYTFSPILCVWFVLIFGIGIYNTLKFDLSVVKAVNPKYIIEYFRRNKKEAWISLGGVVLCTTGCEALFADLGHFTVPSIQISMCCLTYPAIVLAYTGQAAFLRKNNELVGDVFYSSIPKAIYWPMFVVAVLAAITASQAMISATFSIIQQSLSLGCFPRVKIVHTSAKYAGQVYIPEINYLLMLACIGVTLGFRTTAKIGTAYGIAVVFVMTLTSSFLVLIMIMIWKIHIIFAISYIVIIGALELLFLTSVLYKFDQGGYLSLVFAAILITIMFVWNNVFRGKYNYELEHKVSANKLKEILDETKFCRIPRLALFYSELVHGIPPIFKHYAENVPALHSVLIFVTIKTLPISKVPFEERFLFRRLEPKDLNVFRCVVRYGYIDVRNEEESFEKILVERLKEYISDDFWMSQRMLNNDEEDGEVNDEMKQVEEIKEEEALSDTEDVKEVEEVKGQEVVKRDIGEVDKAWNSGVVHLIGEGEVVASKGASIGKRILIDYVYNFLTRNLRQSNEVFDIPHKRMLKVGMIYEL